MIETPGDLKGYRCIFQNEKFYLLGYPCVSYTLIILVYYLLYKVCSLFRVLVFNWSKQVYQLFSDQKLLLPNLCMPGSACFLDLSLNITSSKRPLLSYSRVASKPLSPYFNYLCSIYNCLIFFLLICIFLFLLDYIFNENLNFDCLD